MTIRYLTPESRSIARLYTLLKPSLNPTAPLDRYLSLMTPMQAGKLKQVLMRQQGFSGVFMLRHVWAEKASAEGAMVDHIKRRVNLRSGSFYLIKDITEAVADYLAWLNQEFNG